MPKTVRGWLFDLYPSSKGVTLWIVDEDGGKHCCHDNFVPSFYLHLHEQDIKRAEILAKRCGVPLSIARAQKMELYSGETFDVLQVNVHDTLRFKEAVHSFERFFPHFAFYNSDIPIAQLYLYHTQLFPLAFSEYHISDQGMLKELILHDQFDALEYPLPPLTIMTLRNANDIVPPKYQRMLQLEISYDGKTYLLEQEHPTEILETLNWHLHRFDPDILLTEWGDATLLPQLASHANRWKIPLLLNRDHSVGYARMKESSYFQYGKIVHKDGAFELAGRWHIDIENSFTVGESDLEGLFEVARLTQIPVQHQARTTIGTGLSSMQLSWAYRNNILIPSKKRESEDFKPASILLLADRGGLIFQPVMGYHEQLAELDFVSMYPAIMERHNISPETVNCRCCKNHAVPELGYTLCEKKRGIVPSTLKPILEKRAYYKKKKKTARTEAEKKKYDRRQNALKWMLVTCFGYLGYKNARFGKIEAHEAVNAFSRDAILKAKEIAEANDFTLIHAIVDCMWLKKEGATEQDYEELCAKITQEVGIDISLEGIYNWILFPSSKMDPLFPTANRYVGWYSHGELKVRGIEVRRRDTPKFIKHLQSAMIETLRGAKNLNDVENFVPELLEKVREALTILRAGQVNPLELVIRRHISQEASEYKNNSVNAIVTKALEETGIHLSSGEMIEYIIIDSTGRKAPEKAKPVCLYAFEDGYDIEKYTELTLKAAETLLLPFGYDVERLKEYFRFVELRLATPRAGFRKFPSKVTIGNYPS